MSLNVLVIPEDFRKDQYILFPIIKKMLDGAGKPNANIQVCRDPLLGGIAQALNWERVSEIIEMYRMVQLFLLVVDRDGDVNRRASLDFIESRAAMILGSDRNLLGEHAWQEIEVWALAAQTLPGGWRWEIVRNEIHPKESYFIPFAESRGLTDEPGEGRKTLGREASQNYSRIRSLCSEDVVRLENRIRDWIQATGS